MTKRQINVLYDHQIFSIQKYGGISNGFSSLVKEFRSPKFSINAIIDAKFSNNHHLLETFPEKFLTLPELISSNKIRVLLNRLTRKKGFSNIDILHPTYYYLGDLPKEVNIPMVTTVHDMIPELYPNLFPAGNPHKAKKNYCFSSDLIVCVSEHTKKDLIDVYGIDETLIRIVYHGIDLEYVHSNYKKKIGIPKDYLLFVGKRGGYKNFDFLLDVYEKISKKNPHLYLVCVGGDGFTKKESEKINNYKLSNKIKLINVSDSELRWLYKKAKAFIFPSIYEGFGIPILEALAQDCIPVLSEASCFPEIAQDAAVYFDPDNEESCVEAIEKVLTEDDKSIISRMENRVKDFTWEKVAFKMADVYNEFL